MTAVATATLGAVLPVAPREPTGPRRPSVLWQWVLGVAQMILVGLAFPIAVLLVGLPIALVVRALIELPSWF